LTDQSGKTWQLAGDTSKLSDHVGHQVLPQLQQQRKHGQLVLNQQRFQCDRSRLLFFRISVDLQRKESKNDFEHLLDHQQVS
jgi:hypothetical protein